MKLTKLKARNGFSLLEMVVVVGITVLLSTIALTYNRSGERQFVLFKDQAVVVGLLNRAKSLAIQKYQNPAVVASDKVFCAFGVHFEAPRGIVLFADLGDGGCASTNANYRYDAGAVPPEGLETKSLDVRNGFSGLPGGRLDVLFVAPELTATSSAGLPVTITISSMVGGLSAALTISAAGQIVAD